MDLVTLRKTLSGVVLGLLASLVAHTALYGGQHTVGGSYHDLLMQITSAAALGFVVVLCVIAWSRSTTTADGSVLAARLRDRLPGIPRVVAFAAAWYACIEAIEPRHLDVPWFALFIVLVAAACAVLQLAHAMANAFGRIAVAIFRASFSPLAPSWQRRSSGHLVAHQPSFAHRRFARPPPIALIFQRA